MFDCGSSRAALIPRTHNHAGYPGGIKGTDLLGRMREQARDFGATREDVEVTGLALEDGLFTVTTDHGTHRARSVLLATGVVNHRPPGMDDTLHAEALERGLLRYCPICDGYEVTDRKVGVIGTSDHGTAETIFLRGYTPHLTLISPEGDHDLDATCSAKLDEAGVERVAGPCGDYRINGDQLVLATAEGDLAFDSVYPALGSKIRSDLAIAAGAEATEEGCLTVSDHMETSVPGLFAAGDVVLGLDQISHAMGQAGVAATTVRNHLAKDRPLRR